MFRPKRQKPIEVRVEPIVELDYDLLETKLGNKKNDLLWNAIFDLLCYCDCGSACVVTRAGYHYSGVRNIYYKTKRGYKRFKRKVSPGAAVEEIKKRPMILLTWSLATMEFAKSFMAGEFDV